MHKLSKTHVTLNETLKNSEKSQNAFLEFADSITEIGLWKLRLKRKKKKATPKSYKETFEKLLAELVIEDFVIVMMIDEFPVALEQIDKVHGRKAATDFMHSNRAIRQRATQDQSIQFIYTGSIGLPNVARKMNMPKTINDLNVVEVPPFTEEEARDLSDLLLDEYGVYRERGFEDYLLQKIAWLMPFFIQLVVQLLIDAHKIKKSSLTKEDIDAAIEKASSHRSNNFFASYHLRLKESLSAKESKVALQILREIAEKGEIPLNHFDEVKLAWSVLEILEYDGYINSLQQQYRFNSPILRHWWLKYVR